MAVPSPRRNVAFGLAAVAALIVLAVLANGALNKPGPAAPTPTDYGIGVLGSGSTQTVTSANPPTVNPPTVNPPTTRNPTTAPPTVGPDYPGTHRAYAEAVLAAWKAQDLTRLGDLTTAEVQDQLISIPGPPTMDWTFLSCNDDVGSKYCTFGNSSSELIQLTVSTNLLGTSHAAIAAAFAQP